MLFNDMWIKSYPIIEYYMKTKQNWSWTQHNWSWEHKFQAATRTSHFINIAWESQTALLFQHRWNLISILKPKLKGLYNQYKRIWSISYISHPQVNINSCCTFDGILIKWRWGKLAELVMRECFLKLPHFYLI